MKLKVKPTSEKEIIVQEYHPLIDNALVDVEQGTPSQHGPKVVQ